MAVKKALQWALFASGSLVGATGASAQSGDSMTPFTQTGQAVTLASVATRSTPGYDPLGVRLGVWTLYPSLSTQTVYNDNVYNVSNGTDDVYFSIRPKLTARNNADNHTVTLLASGAFNRYTKLTTEDSNLYSFRADGNYDIATGTSANASASYARQLEPRGTSGDTIIGGSPVAYRVASANLGLNQEAGRFFFNVQGSASKFDYEDVHFQGQDFSQSARNVATYSATGRVGYALNSAVALYTSLSYSQQDYQNKGPMDRNGHSLTAIGGIQFSITSLLTGRAGIGYIKVDFDNPAFSDSSGLNYDLSLQWNPTQLISLSLTGSRSLVRSPVANAGGVIQSNVTLNADYELLRNLILSGSLFQTREHFQGLSVTNRRWNERLGVEYRSSRLISVTLNGTAAQQRTNSVIGRRYNSHTGSVGLLFRI